MQTVYQFAQQHPDFDNGEKFLELLERLRGWGFRDISWCNDTMPSICRNLPGDEREIRIWVNYAAEELRAETGDTTFVVSVGGYGVDSEQYLETDGVDTAAMYALDILKNETSKADTLDIDSAMVNRLADAFVEELEKDATGSDLDDARKANRLETNPHICHTNEFCDANEVMAAAFQNVTGVVLDPSVEHHVDLWNDAWHLAKSRDLRASNHRELMLVDLLNHYIREHGLPEMSADELLHEPAITTEHRKWLSAFVLMWEAEL